jgi:hypothetical protein
MSSPWCAEKIHVVFGQQHVISGCTLCEQCHGKILVCNSVNCKGWKHALKKQESEDMTEEMKE